MSSSYRRRVPAKTGRRVRSLGYAKALTYSTPLMPSMGSKKRYGKPAGYAPRVTDKSQQGMVNTFVPAFNKNKVYAKVRYAAAALTFTASTGVVGTYVFAANGLTDTNITGGNLLPAGYSQLISAYEHYTVYRSKMTVIVTNNSTTPTIALLSLHPDNVGDTDPSNVLEKPYSSMIQLEPAGIYGSSKTLSLLCSVSKFFGEPVTKATSIYRGDAVSNPTEMVYYHLQCYGLKGGSAEVFFQVKIDFDAMWTEPRDLLPSLSDDIMKMVIADYKKKREEVKEIKEIKEEPISIEIPNQPSSGLMSLFSK